MKCGYHPEREAVGTCADCGKEICNLCLTTTAFKIKASQNVLLGVPLADKRYCPTCIDKLIHENVERSPNLNKEPTVLATEISRQETVVVAPIEAENETKVNQVNPSEKVQYLSNMFQGNKIKAELDQVNQECDALRKSLSEFDQVKKERDTLKNSLADIDRLTAYELKEAIAKQEEQKSKITAELEDLQTSYTKRQQGLEQLISTFNGQIEIKRKDLIVLDEEILLQSFGFYKPRYELQNSEMYKVRLDQIRGRQAELVKSGEAVICPANWLVNNDRKEGERMIKDYSKLTVRSFNNECDATILNIKFSNIESIEKKIRKAFEMLNNLTKRMSISITTDYLNLKLEELYLCYEYQVKKHEEKEEQKRIKEQMREEAKLMKEIEEKKLKCEKEEKHYSNAIEETDERLQKAQTDAERNLLAQEKTKLQQKLAEVEKNKQDVLYREQNARAGYVYVISNIGAFGENVYKIGVTCRLDPTERVDELGDSSVPFDFDIHAMIFSDDAFALETALHKAFDHRKVNMFNKRREFFNVPLKEIEQVVKTNFNKPVEFTHLAEAAEYRQSRKLRDELVSESSGHSPTFELKLKS